MKKVLLSFAAGALLLPAMASAEIVEITFNSRVLVYNTPEFDRGGSFHQRISKNVTMSNYSDSRRKGRRSVDIDSFETTITGAFHLERNMWTREYALTFSGEWETANRKKCKLPQQKLLTTTLPLRKSIELGNGCVVHVNVRTPPNPMLDNTQN